MQILYKLAHLKIIHQKRDIDNKFVIFFFIICIFIQDKFHILQPLDQYTCIDMMQNILYN